MKKRIIALAMLAMLIVSALIPAAQAAKCIHSWSWKTVREATCYKTGLSREYCTKCNTTRRDRSIATKNHSWGSYTIERQPTCQLQGLKKRSCNNPGCSATDSATIARVDHNFKFVQIKTKATCTTDGKSEYKCEWCPMHDYRTIPKYGHDFFNGKCIVCGQAQ